MRRRGAERQAAEGVDGQALDVAAQEVGFGRDLPEGGHRRLKTGDRRGREDETRSREASMRIDEVRINPRAAGSACASR